MLGEPTVVEEGLGSKTRALWRGLWTGVAHPLEQPQRLSLTFRVDIRVRPQGGLEELLLDFAENLFL